MSGALEIGVCLTNYGDVTSPEASIGTGRLAEELGYDSVWVSDHILVPPAFGKVFGREFLDPFICLAYAAAETTRVKLGTTVVVCDREKNRVTPKPLPVLRESKSAACRAASVALSARAISKRRLTGDSKTFVSTTQLTTPLC